MAETRYSFSGVEVKALRAEIKRQQKTITTLAAEVVTLRQLEVAARAFCGCRRREDLCCCYDGYCTACRLRDIVEALKSKCDTETVEQSQGPFHGTSELSCCRCGGPVIEFTISNEAWNTIIRDDRGETDQEYLCLQCFAESAAEKLRQLKVTLTAMQDMLSREHKRNNPGLPVPDFATIALSLKDAREGKVTTITAPMELFKAGQEAMRKAAKAAGGE